MSMRTFFFDVCRLLISPQGRWPRLLAQHTPSAALTRHYLTPFMVCYAICLITGGLLFTPHEQSSTGLVVAHTVAEIAAVYCTLLLAAFIADKVSPNFDLDSDFNRTYALLVYAWTPVFITCALIGLFPFMSAFKIICIYMVYLLWTAMPHLPALPVERRLSYTVTLALLSWILHAMLYILFTKITRTFI